MTDVVRRTKGILLIAWAISMLLSSAAPMMRPLTGIQGSARWAIYSAVGVMLITWYLTQKAESSMFLSLMMSASSITSGGAFGFLAIGIASGKATPLVLAAKWAVLGVVTSVFFIRQFKTIGEETPLDPFDTLPSEEEFLKLSPEEQKSVLEARFAEIDAMMSKINADTRRIWRQAALLLVIGAVALGTSLVVKSNIERAKAKTEKPIPRSAQLEQPKTP